jgi:hypothetical protein
MGIASPPNDSSGQQLQHLEQSYGRPVAVAVLTETRTIGVE